MTLFVLKAYGESKKADEFDVEDGLPEARVVGDIDARWTLEVGIEAVNRDHAEALAEEVMEEANWHLGQWHGWELVDPSEKRG